MNPVKRFFKEDIPATFSSGKWRVQKAQLKKKQKQTGINISSSLAELGKKAWAEKVQDEKYKDVFQRLQEFEDQVEKFKFEINHLQEKIGHETVRLNSIITEHDAQIKSVADPCQEAEKDLAQSLKKQKEAEQQSLLIEKMINQNAVSIRNLQNLIDQTEAANPDDKEIKIASYRNTIEVTQEKISELNLHLKQSNEKKIYYDGDLQQLKTKIESYSQQIETFKKQKVLALKPIQDEISKLNQESQNFDIKKNSLINKISELMPEFGAQVYKIRPDSDLLIKEYASIDSLQGEMGYIDSQINVLISRIASVNRQSIMRVVFAFSGMIVLILAGIFLIPKLTGGNSVAQDTIQGNPDESNQMPAEETARGIAPILEDLENRQAIEEKLGVAPPYDGLFMVTDNLTPEEIEPMVFNTSRASVTSNFVFMIYDIDEYRYNQLSAYKEKSPVLLFMSGKTELSDLELYKGQPHLGLFIDDNPSPCTVELSSNPSLKIGDKIFGIDNEEVLDCASIKNVLSSKTAFTPVLVDMQRGTVRKNQSIVPPTVAFPNRIPTKNEYQDNSYFAIYPLSNLESGVYCLIRKETAPEIGYCFIIN